MAIPAPTRGRRKKGDRGGSERKRRERGDAVSGRICYFQRPQSDPRVAFLSRVEPDADIGSGRPTELGERRRRALVGAGHCVALLHVERDNTAALGALELQRQHPWRVTEAGRTQIDKARGRRAAANARTILVLITLSSRWERKTT